MIYDKFNLRFDFPPLSFRGWCRVDRNLSSRWYLRWRYEEVLLTH